VVRAERGGTVQRVDAMAVGLAAWRLGAGRARREDSVQAGAGVQLHARPGDPVAAGDPLFTLHTDTPERFARARAALEGGYAVGEEPVPSQPLVLSRVG
jgi:thymidine phosphorylase